MPYTNFPNGITSFGVPMNMPFTTGTYYFVDADNGNDSNDGLSRDTPFLTLSKAVTSVTTNKDDVIVLSTNGSHQLTAMLTISKSRVHFIGDIYGRHYGQRAKVNYADAIATAEREFRAVRPTALLISPACAASEISKAFLIAN